MVEWPPQRGFVVVTVPVKAGCRAIEKDRRRMDASRPGIEWNYGNVYDAAGQPLMWWD